MGLHMIRRHCLPVRLQPAAYVAALLSAAWLSGCASQTSAPEPSAADPAAAYTQLGVAYLERNNLPRAIAALDRALEARPDDPEALQAMAIAYQRQGDTRVADEYFQRALSQDPGFTRARNNYAAFLYSEGRIAEACRQLEQASQDTQYPNRAQLFTNLGQCHLEQGEIELARQNLERAQAIDVRFPRSYLTLAELEHTQGNHDRAWDQLQTHIRLAGLTSENQRLASIIAEARGDAANATFYSEPSDTADAQR